jgi:Cd2+/Zn2+-exporting ATPase
MTRKQLWIETVSVILSVILIVIGFILESLNMPSLWIAITFGLSFAIGGYAKAKEGILATIKNKSLNVEILMILAALGAFVVGDYAEGAILIFIFSMSGVLESYTTSKSEKELTNLLKLAPETATLAQDERVVLISSLNIGDQVIVKVGEQVPVDGIIISGSTSLDQSAITGEFESVFKSEKNEVYAGSINLESTIIVETIKDPKDSVVQKIVDFVKNAQEKKTKSENFVDLFEKYYVYIVILMSILFMFVPPMFGWLSQSDAFYRGIIVLVVGSPCALVASITPVYLSALSNGARHRILIKGGDPLENLTSVHAVVLDKTGTLTTGIPKIAKIALIDEVEEKDVLSIVKSVEKQSNHPLAKAIVKHLSSYKDIPDLKTTEISGHGMKVEIGDDTYLIGRFDTKIDPSLKDAFENCNRLGHSYVLIIKNEKHIGYIALMDEIRPEAKEVIRNFKALGIHTVMLTGDHEKTAEHIAKQVEVDAFISDCLPEDKAKHIENLQKTYGKVLMVGDGINDAPALSLADVSIAMGSATDISLETSDIVIMQDDLNQIERILTLAKRSKRVILQNIIFSTSVIFLLLVSNVFGLIELPAGVVAHETSTILVILNSLRLLIK